MQPAEVEVAIPAAIQCGYRLFDTATIYRNEEAVGRALAHSGLARSSYWITSKLQTADQGYEAALHAIERSIQRLAVDYIDLYLVHWPGAAGMDPADPRNAELRKGSWKALEEAKEAGRLRAIGVSNYEARHLEEMRQYARILPAVNQIELHPLYYPTDVIRTSQEMGIHIQSYSTLARGRLLQEGFLPQVDMMAKQHGIGLHQLYLRWALQHNFGIIPKSSHPDRIHSNADLFHFELSDEEIKYLDAIHCKNTEKVCWNPASVA